MSSHPDARLAFCYCTDEDHTHTYIHTYTYTHAHTHTHTHTQVCADIPVRILHWLCTENEIQNASRIIFVMTSHCHEIPRNSHPSRASPLFIMCTRAWHCFRCVGKMCCIKALGLQEFDHGCIYAVWCCQCVRCSVSALAPNSRTSSRWLCFRANISCDTALLLCRPARSIRNACVFWQGPDMCRQLKHMLELYVRRQI